jgi:hypothetical protein
MRISLFLLLAAGLTTIQAAPLVQEQQTYDPSADSPMDQLVDPGKLNGFLKQHAQAPYLVFTEDRTHSVRWDHALPAHWIKDPQRHLGAFSGQARPGEFYVFQLVVYAHHQDLNAVSVHFSDLQGEGTRCLSKSAFRCINQGGIDPQGKPLHQDLSLRKGKLLVLWVGIDIPATAQGDYLGHLRILSEGNAPSVVSLKLSVAGPVLPERGVLDAWRLARLRWLDSTVGQSDQPTAPFGPVRRHGHRLNILGRQLHVGDSGLPQQVTSYFSSNNTHIQAQGRSVLAGPMRFEIQTDQAAHTYTAQNLHFEEETDAAVTWHAQGACAGLAVNLKGRLEFDGCVQYRVTVEAQRDVAIQDMRLVVPWCENAAPYLMGLGQEGGRRPARLDWTWDVSKHQDALWMGDVNAGMQIRWKGANYERPLVNIYYDFKPLKLPASWGNENKGGVRMAQDSPDTVTLTAYSRDRLLKQGQTLRFDFDLYLTPFKPLDMAGQWALRYIHPHQGINDPHFQDFSLVQEKGANVVNMHHNTAFNPFINYPYNELSLPGLIDCVQRAHEADLKLKLYYTTREITNNMRELYAFKQLNQEIIFPTDQQPIKTVINRNGPHPWLLKHLGQTGFIPAWRETLKGPYEGMLDLAVITAPDTRWNNFYLEGLKFLVDKARIGGLYIDDTALDRRSLQRARRIMDAQRPDPQIDLHSWNHFNGLAQYAACANLYMELFPYINRLWFGEGFDYNRRPDYWLVEISGLPFGLMGEMLQGGGNPWRGMLYGMTQRLGWSGDPRPIWALWDSFGMQDADMKGYWDPACPVQTGTADLLATVYQKPSESLIAVASWSKSPESVHLQVDWEALGMDPDRAVFYAPPLKGFQDEASFRPGQALPIEPGRGWLLILRSSHLAK